MFQSSSTVPHAMRAIRLEKSSWYSDATTHRRLCVGVHYKEARAQQGRLPQVHTMPAVQKSEKMGETTAKELRLPSSGGQGSHSRGQP